MTVFKAFLKVLNKCKVPIIMYTAFLIFFGGFNMQTSENSTNFVAEKPDILIINKDKNTGITKNLVTYLKDHSNIIKIKDNDQAINDALFYRDVNYIIYIPKNYRNDFLDGKDPKLKIKSTNDYQASYAEMLLSRYLRVAKTYRKTTSDETILLDKINNILSQDIKITITSKADTTALSKTTFYYNFLNYSLLAGCVYVICLILSSFKEENINKRTIISSMDYKKHNRLLLLSNSLFAIVLWLFYVLLSIILVGDIMFTKWGLIYILNSFVFTLCSLAIAFLIGTMIKNKNIVNGIVNVIALGSSFLCGAFVPIEYLPAGVLHIAHILPSYWYIQNNELLKATENINITNLKPILINIIVILAFTLLFIIIANIFTKKNRKID